MGREMAQIKMGDNAPNALARYSSEGLRTGRELSGTKSTNALWWIEWNEIHQRFVVEWHRCFFPQFMFLSFQLQIAGL